MKYLFDLRIKTDPLEKQKARKCFDFGETVPTGEAVQVQHFRATRSQRVRRRTLHLQHLVRIIILKGLSHEN